MALDLMDVAALGRPFTLGMLYDARRDVLIPGLTLWDEESLQKNITESSQHSSKFDISASDTTESKASLLDVEASLKASFLGGLIEVEGSAKYLKDQKKFKNQSRVTCQYKATTDFKQLLMIDLMTLNPQQVEIIEKGLATHIVIAILYGANAFFVFDSEKLDASSVQDVQGSMEAVIKKIPSFDIRGRIELKLTDEEKSLTEKFSCKFYGDFILESNPATFEDAVKTYVQLPKLLGGNKENSVPLKVWLMPLKNFYSKAVELMRGLSVGLVRKAQDALEDLQHVEAACNDLMDEPVLRDFSQIGEKLRRFQTLCVHFRAALEHSMAEKLPLIRAGDEDESKLEQVFESRDESPFSHRRLTQWMDDQEREINVVQSFVSMMEGLQLVPDQSEVDKEVLAQDTDDTLCFVFTSLGSADCRLDDMADYLDSREVERPEEEQWFSSNDVITTMRDKAKVFHATAKGLKNSGGFHFLVVAIKNDKYLGASIYHYRNGILVTDNFSKPFINDVERLSDRRDLIWYAQDLTLDPITANSYLQLSDGDRKVKRVGSWQAYQHHPQRFSDYPQVLCREPLTGRCYWEVDWSAGSSEDVSVGVAYRGLFRKGRVNRCKLGWNPMSWAFGHRWSPPDPVLYAEHNTHTSYYPFPATGFTRLGVYLDWPAGTLSFYRVSSDTLSHVHTFYTKFSEPVYPAFLIWRKSNFAFLSL